MDFSENEELRTSLGAVRLVKRHATRKLQKAVAALEPNYGRHRAPARWELAAVAFFTSGHTGLRRWYDETTDELWRECGFTMRPSYPTVHRRLRELEQEEGAFLDATADVIRRCIAHDPRVFAHAHVDGTEDETHARLVHDCQPGENCQRTFITTKTGRTRSARGHAISPLRAATSEAREEREKWNTEDPTVSEKLARATEPRKTQLVWRDGRLVKRIKSGKGCWYVTRDVEAGVRLYKNGRFWHGYYHIATIDHLTGGSIPFVASASTNESNLFPDVYDRVKAMTGRAPQTVTGDKGFSVEACFKHATMNGTAPIFPHRHGGHTRHDKLTHDRHGVPRCKYCGGPTRQTKFSANNGKPRAWFVCEDGKQTPDCAKQQTIYCETDWRSIIPLPRTEPLYHEIKASHSPYEGVHRYDRERYLVGANDLGTRPRTVGIGPHRLRAAVASLVNWLRIAAKNNWLGSARVVKRGLAKGLRRCKKLGERAALTLAASRVKTGLTGAYGPKAAVLCIGDATPPSRRAPAQGAPQGP
jgi:hypothetical protein